MRVDFPYWNSSVAYRPSTASFSNTGGAGPTYSHTNDALAYDTDVTTYGTLNVTALPSSSTGNYSEIATYSGFSAITFTGTLKILVSSITQDNAGFPSSEAVSSVKVEYSLNGGTSWTTLGTKFGGISDWNQTYLTLALSSQALGNLQVRCTATGATSNNGSTDRCKADATLNIYDIRVE